MSMNDLVKYAIDRGGDVTPLIISSDMNKGSGTMNPSVFMEPNGDIVVNIRCTNYTLYHSENKKFAHCWGPLIYIHPETDLTLTTYNYFAKLNNNFEIEWVSEVDYSSLNVTPLWEFVGLEDARLVRWDNKLYQCGVRRDTTTNGQGRMELSEIKISGTSVREISRDRIPAPDNNASYCEKNWMPILDMPYHFVKWCNTTEIVKFDPERKTCETVLLKEQSIKFPRDLRGGSQVIRWKDFYIAITHEVNLFNDNQGRKDAKYLHRFIVWDLEWNIVKYSDDLSFMGGHIEFSCGMCYKDSEFIISFGFQDNAAYIVKIPENVIESILK